MKEDEIEFETAKLAKEKGFDEECTHGYYDCEEGHRMNGIRRNFRDAYSVGLPAKKNSELQAAVTAPTQTLLAKWLRAKAINIDIHFGSRSWDGFGYYHGEIHRGGDGIHFRINYEKDEHYPLKEMTYEQAMEEALQKALTILP